MESVVCSKEDGTVDETNGITSQNQVYINAQNDNTARSKHEYEVLTQRKLDERSNVNIQTQNTTTSTCNDHEYDLLKSSSEKLTQRIWKQLQDKAVRILFVIQGLTVVALVAIGVILSRSWNDRITKRLLKSVESFAVRNGGWTLWTAWQQCSVTCGVGLQHRERTCTNPKPSFGGEQCMGEASANRICNITDCNTAFTGGWTAWQEWGQCSTTCGIGLQTRDRTCTNPEPNPGGKHCVGNPFENRICSITLCAALNGGWTSWEEWGQCSATCGVGLQNRERTCTSPEPQLGGKHCAGKPHENRICRVTGCAALNGGWTSWEEWGQCSTTCGIGLQSRERTCTNPVPELGGKHCVGKPYESQMCSVTGCTALNGGWAEWTPWGQCGSGLQSRARNCTNPEPKFGGKHCDGGPSEYKICNASEHTRTVGFTAYYASAETENGEELRLNFSKSTYVSDDSFNMSSGVFTCRIPGLYLFSATIVKISSSRDTVSCYMMVNGTSTIRIFANGYSYSYPSASVTVMVKLRKDDRVYLGQCSSSQLLYGPDTLFSGVLVSAD